MLKQIQTQLQIFVVIILMTIVTLILSLSFWITWQTQQVSDSTYIQRMASLIIYQLEVDPLTADEILTNYESEADIYSFLQDLQGNILFQSKHSPFSDLTALQKFTNENLSITSEKQTKKTTVSQQGGLQEVTGDDHQRYYLIPATIITKSGQQYTLSVFYTRTSIVALLLQHAPLYLFIWLISFIIIFLLSRALLQHAFAPTERMLQSQKNFVAAASHELKSPLAVIMTSAESILNRNIDLATQQQLDVIDNECVRMSRLIEDLLLLASSDADKWTIQYKKTDIDSLLITLYEAYDPLCQKQNVHLTLKLSDIPFSYIYTDGERLYQILSIFLDNALQHAINNEHIDIKTCHNDKTLSFFIIDHGEGIADKDKPFIFDRFYCADSAHSPKEHFGLGLSVANELSSLLSGKINFEDTVGGGATFCLIIPYITEPPSPFSTKKRSATK